MIFAIARAGTPAAPEATKNPKEVMPILEAAWGDPIIGGGVKSNGEFTGASVFLVAPVLNTIGTGSTMAGSVLFVEPYLTWEDSDELGASLGLGFRHLFSSQSPADARSVTMAGLLTEGFFVGANVFIDYLDTVLESQFWQLGVGFEAGTRYIELRANYYAPFSDDEVFSHRSESVSGASTRYNSSTSASAPIASGTQIVQDVTTRRVGATTTTTTRRTIELFEEPLEGWDVEVALLVPGIDRYCDVNLIAGYYSYEGDRSKVSDFDGWRTGVEIRPVPAVVLHATWFESTKLYRDNWLVGARFEIPLGRGWRDAFNPRRRHLAERLFEPVHRKNAAITYSDPVSQITGTTTSSNTRTYTVSQSANRIVIGDTGQPQVITQETPPVQTSAAAPAQVPTPAPTPMPEPMPEPEPEPEPMCQ